MIGAVLAISTLVVAQVELRGGMTISAPVTAVSLDGVSVGGDEPRIIGWDSVKRVLGEHAEAALEFRETADKAWRARLRLARGDTGLSCPLFDELFRIYRGRSGPTALMIAEGRIRCLTRSGEQAAAVEPWLEALRLRHAGDVIAGDPPMLPVIDEDTGLVAALPPIWLSGADTEALARSPVPKDEGDAIKLAMAVLYRNAARFESGMEAEGKLPEGNDPGVVFVADLVASRVLEPKQRGEARDRLSAGLKDDMGTWREAWRRVAIGRSLLMESTDADRTAGVFQLLHLPARFARSQRYLAGVALAEVSLELDRRGDQEGAAAIRAELDELDPGGQAATWLEAKLRQRRPSGEVTLAPQDSDRQRHEQP